MNCRLDRRPNLDYSLQCVTRSPGFHDNCSSISSSILQMPMPDNLFCILCEFSSWQVEIRKIGRQNSREFRKPWAYCKIGTGCWDVEISLWMGIAVLLRIIVFGFNKICSSTYCLCLVVIVLVTAVKYHQVYVIKWSHRLHNIAVNQMLACEQKTNTM